MLDLKDVTLDAKVTLKKSPYQWKEYYHRRVPVDEEDSVDEILQALPPERREPYIDQVEELAKRIPDEEISDYKGFDRVKNFLSKEGGSNGAGLGLLMYGVGSTLAIAGAATGESGLVVAGGGTTVGGSLPIGGTYVSVKSAGIYDSYKSKALSKLPLKEYEELKEEYLLPGD